MRHRVRGRKLGRNASHRKAMFRNMACSLIRSIRVDEDAKNKPRVPGRIVTTLPKAKELRPYVEKLITIGRKAIPHQENADRLATSAERNSPEWKQWRESTQWSEWAEAISPALALRRRAFAILRDNEAVDILFDELATRFETRPGGYTRVVKLAKVRLGDAGEQALIEFVGERDRVRKTSRKAPVVADDEQAAVAVTAPDIADETSQEAAAASSEGAAESTQNEETQAASEESNSGESHSDDDKDSKQSAE